jgi:hypothetical protein
MMVSPFRDLRQVLDREFDLELSCTACRRQRLIVTAVVLSLFTRMGWSTAWERVPTRFPVPKLRRQARAGRPYLPRPHLATAEADYPAGNAAPAAARGERARVVHDE